MADMIVSGAGTSAVNGTYVENGTANGKPKYYCSANGLYIAWYEGGKWGDYWYIGGLNGATGLYYSSWDIVATPDLCSSWSRNSGALPVPTVTAAGGGDPSSSIINHIMHYRRLMSR